MAELTQSQLTRQDHIDNLIYDLLQDCVPPEQYIPWDIEYIGEIRDTVQGIIVDKLKIMSEMEFYPYVEE